MKLLVHIYCEMCLLMLSVGITNPKKAKKHYREAMQQHKKDCPRWNDKVAAVLGV